MDSDSVYNFIGTVLPGVVLVLAFFLLCGGGAWAIANTICKRIWKKTVPKPKPIYFLGIFLLSLFAIVFAFLLIVALAVPFGRTRPVPADYNLRNH